MGHYSAHEYSATKYQLLSSTTWTEDSWATLTIVTDGLSNIKGVKLKVYIVGLGSGATSIGCKFYARPNGTAWAATPQSMTPGTEKFIEFASGSVNDYVDMLLLDVPVSGNQFQYYASVEPDTDSRTLVIQQMGVWV
jgi:hypothetical protein